MKKSIFLTLIAVVGFQIQSFPATTEETLLADRPNIILAMVDDMGYSDISCYGSEIPTPNIDRLAAGGIRFSQFYNTSRCCPTRASLLTGLYQHQTGVGHMMSEGRFNFDYGVDGYRGQLNRNCVTLAEVLRSAGYQTWMAGKWHLGDDMDDRPLQRGWDKFYGSLSGAFSYFKPQGDRHLMEGNEALPPPDPKTYYTTDAFAERAIQWISEKDDEKPFFLYLAFNAPHWPLHAKEEDIRQFVGKYMKGWDQLRQERFERQVKLGLFDPSLGVSPRDANVRPWDEVPA
ncbi:MAG: sulfatase-like hydrolase/transferase, partial [Verrucomicrobiae bacterium]|nr:sulfatase-like hydrolase/transferase [Verrucomicrobiae bacterium]